MYWGCIYFLFSFSILIFYIQILYSFFVSIYFFVWHHSLVLSSSSLFFFFFYDNHQQRESKSVLRYDKSVIMEPTDLIFFTKMSLYSFSRKWKYQKVVFSFCIQILFFFILKMKTKYKYKVKTSFLVVGPTKNWKWIQNTPFFCLNQTGLGYLNFSEQQIVLLGGIS